MDYTYDLDGNLLKTADASYTYDALDRLIKVEQNGLTVSYQYDADNRRISKTIGAKTHTFLYDGQHEIGCGDNQLRILGAGNTTVAIELNGTSYAPLHNNQGSIVALLTTSGTIAESYRYSAFGEEETSQPINPWRFSSKRTDETGLVFFGKRYYHPSLGRWLTQDPAGLQGGPNLYAYVNNTPLTLYDLFGLMPESFSGRMRESLTRAKDKIWNGIKALGSKLARAGRLAVHTAGHIIYDVAFHAIPIPVIRDIPLYVGHRMMGGTRSNYVSPSSLPTITDEYHPNVTSTNGYRVVSIGGQNNRWYDAYEVGELIGNSFGLPVDIMVNQTHGFFWDTLYSLAKKLGFETLTSELAYRMLRRNLRESSDTILVVNHSQGALTAYDATQRLSPEDQGRLVLYNFGPAKIIPKGNLKASYNYISPFDPVPFGTDLVGIVKSFFNDDYNVEFLKPKKPVEDHRFLNGPYHEQLNKLGKKFQDGFRH